MSAWQCLLDVYQVQYITSLACSCYIKQYGDVYAVIYCNQVLNTHIRFPPIPAVTGVRALRRSVTVYCEPVYLGRNRPVRTFAQ
jgi:hypothetical protein